MDDHEEKCRSLRDELLRWKEGIEPSSNFKKPFSHMTREKAYKKKSPPINSAKLNKILKVDPKNKIIITEPYVTQEELVKATLPYGLIPPVVAEFKKITVGGAIMGSSLESSAHRFGQFNDPCHSYEILLGNGSIVSTSPQNDPDLFYGVASSFGTLGILLSAEIPLVEAKPYVEVEVQRFSSIKEFANEISLLCKNENRPDYIEGLIFSKNDARILKGRFVDSPKTKVYSQKSPASPWYYQYVLENDHFTMTTYDYIFRYDRGAFWMGSYALWASLLARFCFENTKFPPSLLKPFINHKKGKYNQLKTPPYLFRLLAGWAMSSYDLYKLLHQKKEGWFSEQFVIQDFYLPEKNLENYLNFTIENHEILPIWICPCKGTTTPQWCSPHKGEGMFYDVGIYGWPLEPKNGPIASQELENKAYELGGRKMLYSTNYLSEDQIKKHYPVNKLDQLRAKYQAGLFPSFLDKVLK